MRRRLHLLPAGLLRSRWAFAALWVATGLAMAGRAQTLETLGPLDATGRVTYFIGAGAPGSGYMPGDEELAAWALDEWSRAVGGRISFERAPEDTALVRVYWVPAGAGQYGEMRGLRVGGRRGAAVFIRPDTDGLGPEIAASARTDRLFRDAVVYLTCVHELGHAIGLSHTADIKDIMYSFGFGGDIRAFFDRYRTRLRSRADIARTSGLSGADAVRASGLYPTR